MFRNIIRKLYHTKIIDHYENPRNVGSLNKLDKDVGIGLVGAPACGDGTSVADGGQLGVRDEACEAQP